MKRPLLLLLGLGALIPLAAQADLEREEIVAVEPEIHLAEMPRTESERLASLAALHESISLLRQQLEEARDLLEDLVSPREREDQIARIEELRVRLAESEGNFLFFATGVDPREIGQVVEKEFDLRSEAEKLVQPLVSALQAMTEEARRLDSIREEIQFYEARREVALRALQNLDKEAGELPESLVKPFGRLRDDFKLRLNDADNRLRALRFQLRELEGQKRPFVETARDAVSNFFRTRGRNLFFAISGFILTFVAVNMLHKRVNKLVHRLEARGKHLPFRLIDVGFYIGSVIFSLLASILVLYLSGDWLLLSLIVIILIGVVLAARAGLPLFIEQLRFMLNMGEVRDGERIVFEGVPYRVDSLGFQTMLGNPLLTGGVIRLSMRHLIGLRSRPFRNDEPWFPCCPGEWVRYGDDCYGEVILQTPERVDVRQLGGSIRSIGTAEFLRGSPLNLSHGFQIVLRFGLDYRHQADITGTIANTLEEELGNALRAFVGEERSGEIHALTVEFAEAGSSALEFDLVLDAGGGLAPLYDRLRRVLQAEAVNACNRHAWEIPFTQITLHQADNRENQG